MAVTLIAAAPCPPQSRAQTNIYQQGPSTRIQKDRAVGYILDEDFRWWSRRLLPGSVALITIGAPDQVPRSHATIFRNPLKEQHSCPEFRPECPAGQVYAADYAEPLPGSRASSSFDWSEAEV
jgi:hypothetical protein